MPLEQANPQQLGFDPQRLDLVEAAIARDIDQGLYDGAALAVGRRGSLALFTVQGYAHRETQRALKEDDVFVSFSQLLPNVESSPAAGLDRRCIRDIGHRRHRAHATDDRRRH